MTVQSIPNAYHTAKPYFIVNDGMIAFYKTAFDTTELVHLAEPGGKAMHAETAAAH